MAKTRRVPIKRDPFFNGAMSPIDFGDSSEAVMAKTSDDKASKFLSDYMDRRDPIERYKNYFNSSAKDIGHLLSDVKMLYKKLVLEKEWTEEKFTSSLEQVFVHLQELNTVTMDRQGLAYDRKKLGSSNNRRRR